MSSAPYFKTYGAVDSEIPNYQMNLKKKNHMCKWLRHIKTIKHISNQEMHILVSVFNIQKYMNTL